MRKITSMIMVWTLVVLFVNSIVLYVVPEGRVSYWADWTFLGLTKGDWGAQHTTVGFLFLFAGLLHIYYNWKPIVNYMKNKAKEFKFFSVANSVALIITFAFVVGTYMNVPPMSTIMEISEGFKDAASEKYGEPPYGHAESSSLKMFTKREGLDLAKSLELLKTSGIEVKGEQDVLKDIAKRAGKSPQQIYMIIKPAGKGAKSAGNSDGSQAAGEEHAAQGGGVDDFINGAKSGLGKKTIDDLSSTYGLNAEAIVAGLNAKGIKAAADQKLKDIAEANDNTPMGVYEAIVEIVAPK